MRKRWVSLWVTLAVAAWSAAVPVGAQQVLNNEAVVKMVKAGLAEELIIANGSFAR